MTTPHGLPVFTPIPAPQLIADFVSTFSQQRNGVGPTRQAIRETYPRGMHDAEFAALMEEAQAQSLIESYVDDAGTQRFRPITQEN